MTDVIGDLADIAGQRGDGIAVLRSTVIRPAIRNGGSVIPDYHRYGIVNGHLSMTGLDPGPALIHLRIGRFNHKYLINIPDISGGSVDLVELIQQYDELPTPLVSQAWRAAEAARHDRDEVKAFVDYVVEQILPEIGASVDDAKLYRDAAEMYAQQTADMIPPATDSQLGKIKLRGDLGGTAEEPRIANGAIDFGYLSDLEPAPGSASLYAAAWFAAAMLGSYMYNDGWSRDNLAQHVRDELDNKAGLDSSGKIIQNQLPAIAVTDFLGNVASQTAMLALKGERGDWCNRTDKGTEWQLIAEPSSSLSSWMEKIYPASDVTSVAGRKGAVTISSTDVTDATTVGKNLLKAADAQTARDAISAPRINYRNAHAPSTAYQLGDIVDWNGERRICASAHTSDANPAVINGYFIRTGIVGFTERGDWSATATYQRGDVVNANHSRWCYNAAAPSTPGAWNNANWMYLGLRVVIANSDPGGGVL